MQINEKTISINGINTRYYEAGDKGSVVVLLHGGGVDSAQLSWSGMMIPLAESGFRVITPDFPGYGESGFPSGAGTVAFYLDFFPSFVDALNLRDVILMGISMGGSIAIGTYLEHPSIVKQLILVDSYGIQKRAPYHLLSYVMVKIPGLLESTWPLVRMNRSMARWSMKNVFHDTRLIPDELLDAILVEARRPNAGKAFTIMQRDEILISGVKTNFLDRLHQVKVPTLLIHGELDAAVPLACAEDAQRRIVGSKLVVFEGAGHWVQREQPEKFRRIVIDFLN